MEYGQDQPDVSIVPYTCYRLLPTCQALPSLLIRSQSAVERSMRLRASFSLFIRWCIKFGNGDLDFGDPNDIFGRERLELNVLSERLA